MPPVTRGYCALLFAIATKASDMTEFVTCSLRCPVCNAEFSADEVHGARSVGCDTDFRPLFIGPSPLLSHIHACPGCRYSGYREAFETEPSDEDELIEPVEEQAASLPRPSFLRLEDADYEDLRRYARSGELTEGLVPAGEEPFGASRYLLAARVHEYVHEEDPLGAAHYYLRASWSARATGDIELERESQRQLLLCLSSALDTEQTSGSQQACLNYLAGEVARRVGDFATAIDFLARVERDADLDDDDALGLTALARRQMLLASTQCATNAVIPLDWPEHAACGVNEAVSDYIDDDDGGTGTLN